MSARLFLIHLSVDHSPLRTGDSSIRDADWVCTFHLLHNKTVGVEVCCNAFGRKSAKQRELMPSSVGHATGQESIHVADLVLTAGELGCGRTVRPEVQHSEKTVRCEIGSW